MRTTLDAGGRVVVPKTMRDRLGLGSGDEVEITESEGAVVLEPVAEQAPEINKNGIMVIAASGQRVTADQVRALRDAGRY